MPTVSIIIPTYKHRAYVAATLESVFAQTFRDYEVIVVNDGSPDDTAAVLAPFARDGRIRYFEQANAGQAAARNKGLAEACGEFIAFLDDDDLWPPDKLQWQVDALQSARWVAVGGNGVVFADRPKPPNPESGNRAEITIEDAFRGCPFMSPGQVLIRTSALRTLNGIASDIWGCDDYDLWIRLASLGPIGKVDRCALFYRSHASNASLNHIRMFTNGLEVIRRRRGMLPHAARSGAERDAYRWLYTYFGSKVIKSRGSDKPGSGRDIFRVVRAMAWPVITDSEVRRMLLRDLLRAETQPAGTLAPRPRSDAESSFASP
jgi:glycosyltransferase involved in cell wall biosynthesis